MSNTKDCLWCGSALEDGIECETCNDILLLKEDDLVEQPNHYARWKIEPITFIMRNGIEFWRGNIIKYATRAGYKRYENQTTDESEVTDLKKVIRYCEMRINQINGETKL
jgi:hypothetical protein